MTAHPAPAGPHRHTVPARGESAAFHFESQWTMPVPPGRVWEELIAVEHWPAWWPGIRSAHLVADPGEGLPGRTVALTVGSPLGHRLHLALELASADPPGGALIRAAGDLRGTGRLTATEAGAGTALTITWCVVSRPRLVRALRALAPWAHGRVMAAGERGLRERLAAD
ncbi:SRPBCC family protein [Brevibacterium sp. R8603A2]|uniref:SRPBCC family protein n=1 Tax=Brevibacterium sp. R8603A2 TaxID=2929779 RepID=UPI0032B8831A